MPAMLLVGTKKGAFVYRSDGSRKKWDVSAPILPGWSVANMSVDRIREEPRLYAAASHWAWGPSVARSDDGGKTWEQRSPGLAFPADSGITVQNVWNVTPGPADQPGVVFAGTQPAGLFRSEDWGDTWASVSGLNDHEYRTYWGGSGGDDSSLHSIEIDPRDPKHMFVSISSGGSYVTTDGGENWAICSHRAIPTTPAARKFVAEIAEQFPSNLPPGVDPAAADEMHKLRIDPKNPARMWGQSHIGVFRSDDSAMSWQDVTEGLPSFHGFPIAVSQRPLDSVYVVPLEFEANNFRVCPGQFTVYRSRDAGCTWQALTDGLPAPTTTRASTAKGSRLTGSTRKASTSVPATARCSGVSTAATTGNAFRGHSRLYSR